jgi:Ca-activated chloride channel family protein
MTNTQAPTLLLNPRRPAVPAGFATILEVLVRIGAPAAPATTVARAPLHLAIVIDRSGSMSGKPLEEAKKAASFIIENLSFHDRASIVVFDEKVDVLAPLSSMGNRSLLLSALRCIESGGATNLHGGWLAGAEALAHAAKPSVLSRVILLSDGCANRGLDNAAAISTQCAEMASAGVTTSTYGLGENFNEALMIDMARAGQGNSYYGQTASDLMDPFREEFELLNALYARQLVLQVRPAPGVRVDVVNQYPALPKGGWRLPDLAYDAEAWALLRLTVPASIETPDPLELVAVTLGCQAVTGEPIATQASTLQVPVVSPALFGTLVEDDLVARRVAELEAAKLQERAREAAQLGDWGKVDALVDQVTALGTKNSWVAGVAQQLRQLATGRKKLLFEKETAYGSARMRGRVTAVNEAQEDTLDMPSFLRRQDSQGKATPAGTPRK